jgi:hypothetical protein
MQRGDGWITLPPMSAVVANNRSRLPADAEQSIPEQASSHLKNTHYRCGATDGYGNIDQQQKLTSSFVVQVSKDLAHLQLPALANKERHFTVHCS